MHLFLCSSLFSPINSLKVSISLEFYFMLLALYLIYATVHIVFVCVGQRWWRWSGTMLWVWLCTGGTPSSFWFMWTACAPLTALSADHSCLGSAPKGSGTSSDNCQKWPHKLSMSVGVAVNCVVCKAVIRLLQGHGFMPVYNGPNLSYSLRHLRRNTEYKFRVGDADVCCLHISSCRVFLVLEFPALVFDVNSFNFNCLHSPAATPQHRMQHF